MGTRPKYVRIVIDLKHSYSSFGQSLKGKLGFFKVQNVSFGTTVMSVMPSNHHQTANVAVVYKIAVHRCC